MESNTLISPFWDMIEGRAPLSAASRLLGWNLRALDRTNGVIKVEFSATPSFINPLGSIQGGMITAMLDDAMGHVATAYLGGHHMAPTVDLKVSFMRPASVGPLFVEAHVVHRGRSTVFLDGAMWDKEDRLIATASATSRIYDWPTAPKTN